MAKKRLGAEQILTKLRQIEMLQSQGKSVAAACKEAGLTEQSYYRHREEYGGPVIPPFLDCLMHTSRVVALVSS